MTYSGAEKAKTTRETLGSALGALQQSPDIPPDVMAVVENVAQAVGALFEAENASSEVDGKSCIRRSLGWLSQTLALLQDLRANHPAIERAAEAIAKSMSLLYPLTTVPSKAPPPPSAPGPAPTVEAKALTGVEANVGANTETNFYVGFSGEISEGGVFIATYTTLPVGTAVQLLVTLPGGFEVRTRGFVRFVHDPMDLTTESEPGMGVQFENLGAEPRELILRFIRKRPPMFYDD